MGRAREEQAWQTALERTCSPSRGGSCSPLFACRPKLAQHDPNTDQVVPNKAQCSTRLVACLWQILSSHLGFVQMAEHAEEGNGSAWLCRKLALLSLLAPLGSGGWGRQHGPTRLAWTQPAGQVQTHSRHPSEPLMHRAGMHGTVPGGSPIALPRVFHVTPHPPVYLLTALFLCHQECHELILHFKVDCHVRVILFFATSC
jgi:hypothetical protein